MPEALSHTQPEKSPINQDGKDSSLEQLNHIHEPLSREDIARSLGLLAVITCEKPPEPKVEPKNPPEYPHASKWGVAALEGKVFSIKDGLVPATKKELFHAEKMYATKSHLGTLNAKLRVERDGIYKLDGDGKSGLRKDGSLSHLPRSMQRSIKRTEKIYRKTKDQQKHAQETLEHSGEQKRFGRLRKVFKRKH